ENLLFWAALYGVPTTERGVRATAVLERLGLSDRAGQVVWSLSRGLMQRAALAKALVHDPRVLLLDEPFTGLDLAAAAELRTLLGELRGAGRVLVLATHNVDEGDCWASCAVRGACWCSRRTTSTRVSSSPQTWRSSGTGGSCSSRRAGLGAPPRSPRPTAER